MPTTYAIIQGNKYMDATLYTGSNAAATIINAGQFQPDFAWFKRRDASASNALNDSVRGVTKSLSSNLTDSEYTSAGGKDLTAFNSNGFSLGPVDVWSSYNASGASLVAWQWKAGAGSNVTNTTGTITSTVSANTTAGFSIVTYTGQNSDGTVGHGLGAVPQFIIIKNRTSTSNWVCYQANLGNTGAIELSTNSAFYVKNYWQNTTPTSSVFSLAYNAGNNNGTLLSGQNYVAYCWTPIPGFSQFGSYTGNGSADGPFIYTGFRPKYWLIKCTSAVTDWFIFDSSRNLYNVTNSRLWADTTNAESSNVNTLDLLSNGFKLRDADGAWNASGATYVYACFAETPFKYAGAR